MKVLFLAFEGEARLMAELAVRFKSRGDRVFVAGCDHFNVTHSRGEVFDHYRSRGLLDSEWCSLDEVYRDLNALPEDMPDEKVDWDYLRNFEQKYCRRFTLLELAAMDPLMSGAYHHRNIYYRPENKMLFFKFLEIQARWLERIFCSEQYDMIVTVNFQYFIKAAFFSMATARGVPFLMAATCRVSDLHLLYDNFSLGTPQDVLDEMARLKAVGDRCVDAESFIQWLAKERRPAYADFELTTKTIKEQMRIRFRLREILWWLTRYPKSVLFVHKHYRGLLRRNYFLPSYFASLRAFIVGLARRIGYFRHRELTRNDLPSGPFIFFPLHLMPENSVLTLSRTFDEMECLFQLAKALPAHWRVVVKINPNMLASYDTHPNEYYRQMARLPNVQFIDPTIPSGQILDKASAVACISGTALLEGAVLGKPGIRWGRTEFEAIDLIREFNHATLQDDILERPSDNLHHYIQSCYNLGVRLDLRLLSYPMSSSLSADQTLDYESQVSALEQKILERHSAIIAADA